MQIGCKVYLTSPAAESEVDSRGAAPRLMEEHPSPEAVQSGQAPAPKSSRFKRWLHGKNSWFARFARQDLRGWTPILSANFVVFAYLLAGVVLLPIGIAVLVSSLNVQEHRVS